MDREGRPSVELRAPAVRRLTSAGARGAGRLTPCRPTLDGDCVFYIPGSNLMPIGSEVQLNPNISMSLDRADELAADMEREHQRSLQKREVSARAVHLTHEVCERLRSVLDRLARAYWEKHVAPDLPEEDREAAVIYFPIVKKNEAFDAVMGRWRWKAIKDQHQPIADYLRSLQPYVSSSNDLLRILNELALQSKHIDLVPQKRVEQRRVAVTGPNGGQVSWGGNSLNFGPGGGIALGPGGGISFGPGGTQFFGNASAMGAPIDPRTQRIIPTPGHSDRIEIWVSFQIDRFNVDALRFCADIRRRVREIAVQMSNEFDL